MSNTWYCGILEVIECENRKSGMNHFLRQKNGRLRESHIPRSFLQGFFFFFCLWLRRHLVTPPFAGPNVYLELKSTYAKTRHCAFIRFVFFRSSNLTLLDFLFMMTLKFVIVKILLLKIEISNFFNIILIFFLLSNIY